MPELLSSFGLPTSLERCRDGGLDLSVYSEFKYGCVRATRLLADVLFETASSHFDFGREQHYVTSTFFSRAPSASHWLARTLAEKINRHAFRRGLPSVGFIDLLQRASANPTFKDYGTLDGAQRRAAQDPPTSLLLLPSLRDGERLIVVNDVSVSGAQLRRHSATLEQLGMSRNVTWLYLGCARPAENETIDPRIEDHMNHFSVRDDESFLAFLARRGQPGALHPTKRLLLKLLTSPEEVRERAMSSLDDALRSQLLDHAIGENMHLSPTLSLGVRALGH